jgi:hypothetical protein
MIDINGTSNTDDIQGTSEDRTTKRFNGLVWTGPVALSCRSTCSFMLPSVQKRRGFSSPMLRGVHWRQGLAQQDPERAWIVEAVDVFHRLAVVCLQTMRGEDGHLSQSSCFPRMPPDQFCFDGFEEGSHRRIVVAIALATHGHFEAILSQNFLIRVGTILRPTDALLSVKQRFAFDLSVCVDVR